MPKPLAPQHFRSGEDSAKQLGRLVQDLRDYHVGAEAELRDVDRRVTFLTERAARRDVLWRWNETDVTQFGLASVTTPTGGTAGRSYNTSTTEGPSVRFAGNGLQGRFMVPILGLRLPPRWVFRFRATPSAVSANNLIAVLVLSNASASNLYGIELSQANASTLDVFRCQAGTFTAATTITTVAPSAAWPGNLYEIEGVTRYHAPYVGTPSVSLTVRHIAVGGSGAACVQQSSIGLGSWSGVTADRICLGLNADNAASSETVDFQELELLRHPMDR